MPAKGAPLSVILEGASRAFGTVEALREVTLGVAPGELIAVVGPSGCGKSTLLELVCGLQRPSSGRVEAAPAVYMPQRDALLPWLGALDNAALGLRAGPDALGRDAARAKARPLLAELGLGAFEDARPHQLSGGMRQRVAFLRTLLAGREVLCLDEPFGALDALTRTEVRDWFADLLAKDPRTVVLVTHDVEEAVVLADRVVVLSPRPGRVVAQVNVDLPRPRSAVDPDVVALRALVLEALT